MKLRHQVFALLLLPLFCQLVTVGLTTASFEHVDEVGNKEVVAKKIIADCQDLEAFLGRVTLLATTPRFFNSSMAEADLAALSKKTSVALSDLQNQCKDNVKASALAHNLSANVEKLVQNIHDLSGSYNSKIGALVFSQYFETSDLMESTKVLLDRILDDVENLKQIYGPIAQEFKPASLAARREMRTTIALALFANVLAVLALAIVINKKTLSRLKVLMTNMQYFAEGTQKYQKLDGQDEIAELDGAFQKMADQRNRLEDIRKSMRAMVSHDLRSPLTSMTLAIELILEDLKDAPEHTIRSIKRLYSESGRLKRLSDTLLDIEKIEDGSLEVKAETVPCDEILSTAVESLRAQLDRKKITVMQSPCDDITCWCDKDRTIQVLVNFISNATKFTPARSTIEVRARGVDSGRIRFEVLDEGPGVPADKIDLLFNKFKQLEQSAETKQQGSGLGLYICKMLVNAQHGDLGYMNRPERGSCFWFEVPGDTESRCKAVTSPN